MIMKTKGVNVAQNRVSPYTLPFPPFPFDCEAMREAS